MLAYVNRAAYYLNFDRIGEAEEELKYVLDHEPDDATRELTEQYLAMCHEKNKKSNEADGQRTVSARIKR